MPAGQAACIAPQAVPQPPRSRSCGNGASAKGTDLPFPQRRGFEDLLSRDFETLCLRRFKMERCGGGKGKGAEEKGINPDGNTTFSVYRHCGKAARLKSTTGKANASMRVCTAEEKRTEMHVQPLCIQIPTAASFPPQQISSWLVPTRMVLPGRGGSASDTTIVPQNPFKQGKGATSVSPGTWKGPKLVT